MEKKKRKIDELKPKHREFLLNYFKLGMNGRKAYMMTFPKVKQGSADAHASRLLNNGKVLEAKQEYLDEFFAEKEKVVSRVFNKLVQTMDADISEFIDENGDVKVNELQKLNTYAIAQYDQTITETANGVNVKRSIKLKDTLKAIEQLTKILGMAAPDKVEHSGEIIILPPEKPNAQNN